MKRLSLLGFIGLMASFLAGCPIYDDNGTCNGDCSSPSPGSCRSSTDCGVNETCGSDNQCHTGDCTIWGCPEGNSCVLNPDQTASCVPGTSGTGGSSSSSSSSSGSGGTGGSGGGVTWCGNPDDCGAGQTCAPDGTCKPGDCNVVGCIFGYACNKDTGKCDPQNPAACGMDADCTAGWACVSGICTAPADQCSDQTQCPANDKCVAGKCTPGCAKDADCPASYTCDTTLGICSKPTKSCTITNDCGGPDAVCVNGTCVPRSQMGECPAGEVWVENGCIPSQSASFVCKTDGAQDACASGSICLHHSCYISCDAPNQSACNNQPSSLDVCKSVTTSSGAHNVCGSNNNLGGECDPTAGKNCQAGKICIDGFCK
jgi:hypothetical protein